ncbi:MAG: hypothetical protein M1286_03895 [Candidatus Marsarchaeota archaeon]|nr:hypothetical protein [Candidatus Marsarchaeota archaeon]
MKREIYLWVALVLVIAAAALYVRYFYQSTISVAIGISPASNATIYPYQKAAFTINIFNNGSSAIENMSLGILVNGNLSTLYKATLPAGKESSIAYNYSPTEAGNYTIQVVADPGKLYAIADRSQASASASVDVVAAENATPSALLPKENITSFRQASLTNGAYLLGTYLFDQFNVSGFTLTGNGQIDSFLKPVLNLTSYYIKNISVAEATYSTNASQAYSVWIKGYLSPNIFAAATFGSSLSTTNVTTSAGDVTFIKMLNDTTFCGWYSGGWIKILAEENGQSCYLIINATAANKSEIHSGGLGNEFGSRLSIANATLLGNYSSTSGTGDSLARLSLINNSSFVYDTISNVSGPRNPSCIGLIRNVGNTSYCSTYIFAKSKRLDGIALIRTTAYVGAYNLTAFSLINASSAISQVYSAASMLQSLNVTGVSLAFKSGIVNTCAFNNSFSCSNMTYNNGTATFRITNNMSSTAVLNSVKCYINAGVFPVPLNATLAAGESYNITTHCYNVTTPLSGISLNLHLGLSLNYTSSNSTSTLAGSAFIPLG